MADFLEAELERKLNLYQRFVKLYEYHGDLLDEILKIESILPNSHSGINNYFLEGVIEEEQVSLITNLSNGSTQRFVQSQGVWVLGRDPLKSIFVSNPYISRHHAAIYYVEATGCFYFSDLESTNGSFVNGEPVYHGVELKNGDRICMGTLTFSFFVNTSTQVLADVDSDILAQLKYKQEIPSISHLHQRRVSTELLDGRRESTLQCWRNLELIDPDREEQEGTIGTNDHEATQINSNLHQNPIYRYHPQNQNVS
ncbi:FHA domain-containing protein [Calothrix sp. NIES-3974]|uniref:FHA domain-containing protein n=1 Tax=Calothrix sp. NIES-3974 TaxID=2005462 RepID=UPI000B614FAE|nr:FHA domain-containing protein [Calothrix sp. NIES-3974]BAZ05098.1 FHA domain-containing protein [Calothrix sp. NIES-3974]